MDIAFSCAALICFRLFLKIVIITDYDFRFVTILIQQASYESKWFSFKRTLFNVSKTHPLSPVAAVKCQLYCVREVQKLK